MLCVSGFYQKKTKNNKFMSIINKQLLICPKQNDYYVIKN